MQTHYSRWFKIGIDTLMPVLSVTIPNVTSFFANSVARRMSAGVLNKHLIYYLRRISCFLETETTRGANIACVLYWLVYS